LFLLSVLPPTTVDADNLTTDKANGLIVTAAVCEIPPWVAVTITLRVDFTLVVIIGNWAVCAPAGTVMICGTEARPALLLAWLTGETMIAAGGMR